MRVFDVLKMLIECRVFFCETSPRNTNIGAAFVTRIMPVNVEKEMASDALESSLGKLYHVPLYTSSLTVHLKLRYN